MRVVRDSLSRIWTITRREIGERFDHPAAYALLGAFLGINALLSFRRMFAWGVASLRPMVESWPWMFLLLVPAACIRGVAGRSSGGSDEVALTQPQAEFERLAGTYLGAVLFLWIGLALTLSIPLTLGLGAKIEWAPVVAQYAGACLLVAGLTGIGVWTSSLTRNRILAFVLAFAVECLFVLVGLEPRFDSVTPTSIAAAERLAVLSHFASVGRGVIDVRDVMYFGALAATFLAFAYAALLGGQLVRTESAPRRLRPGVIAVAATALVVSLLGGHISGRLDLTPGKVHTLSPATKRVVRGLDDVATLTVFASDGLPVKAELLKQALADLLSDLRAEGGGKIRVVWRNPATDDGVRRDAQGLGIVPVKLNVFGASGSRVKEGYLGLGVQFSAARDAIPLVDRTDDLEYRVVAALRGLTQVKKPVIGVVVDGLASVAGIETLQKQLAKAYDIRNISMRDSSQPASDVSMLLLAGTPDSLPAGAVQRMRSFFQRGGGALVMAGGTRLSDRRPTAVPSGAGWNPVLVPFGVSVRNDLVYDLEANDIVLEGRSDGTRVDRHYPFLVRARSTRTTDLSKVLNSTLLPWPSTIDTVHSGMWSVTPLFVSSDAAGVSSGETNVDLDRADYQRTGLAQRLLGVQVSATGGDDPTASSRVILIASSPYASNATAQRAPENLLFALQAVDWVARDATLMGIRPRDTRPPALAFRSAVTRKVAMFGNVLGFPAMVILVGTFHAVRRRRTAGPGHQANVTSTTAEAAV
jgi:ABC-type uncharacterized transport system involved in gliding motility auxiliary subunit